MYTSSVPPDNALLGRAYRKRPQFPVYVSRDLALEPKGEILYFAAYELLLP